MGYYKDQFNKLECFSVEITSALVDRFVSCCVYFETKDQHSAALNSPLLGVIPIYFTSTDINLLFSVMDINVGEIERICADSEYTEDNWVITNDPYNNVIIYLIYRVLNSTKIPEQKRNEGCMALLKLLHYKYFTSLVGNSYPYGADEATMSWVINDLNKKFDLAKLESWRRVIEDRCEYLLSESSNHRTTLRDYDDDVGIIYVLSDTQSNIRQKIVRINGLYYTAKENKEAIGNYKTLDAVDGVKIISSTVEIFDHMNVGMQMQIQTASRLLDMELIEVISSKYKEVSNEYLRMLLTSYCDTNILQTQTSGFKSRIQLLNKITGDQEPVIVSCTLLMTEFIQKTYRYCIMSKDVNMSSKKAILLKVINAYTSSQMADQDILTLKRSFVYFVTKTEMSRRPTTISALSLCLIIYFLIRSFEYIK